MSIKDYVNHKALTNEDLYTEQDFTIKTDIFILGEIMTVEVEASCNVYGSGKLEIAQARIIIADSENELSSNALKLLKDQIQEKIESEHYKEIKELAHEVRAAQ